MPPVPSRRAGLVLPSEIRNMSLECARVGGINLAQGICDTEVPPEVRRAAAEAIEAGQNTYSRFDGTDALRRALAAKLARHGGLAYDPEGEILVTAGATGAFYVAAQALLEPGDEVILFEPYYGYHLNTLFALEAVPRYVALAAPDFRLDPAALHAEVGPRTKAIVVNTPANPCGKVFARAELEAIAALAERHDLVVFSDEVYEHFVFDGRVHLSPAALPGMRRRTVIVNALSKTFAITGWRIGWIAADAALAAPFGALNDLYYVCAPTPLQQAAARGLELLPESFYLGIGREYAAKRDLLCRALARAGLPPCVPEGAYYALADLSRLPGTTGKERALALLRQTGLATVPGEAFFRGEPGRRFARFCFGKTDDDLAEACRRLEKLV
jgi:aminotransferase